MNNFCVAPLAQVAVCRLLYWEVAGSNQGCVIPNLLRMVPVASIGFYCILYQHHTANIGFASLLSHVLYTVSASYGKHWLLFSHTYCTPYQHHTANIGFSSLTRFVHCISIIRQTLSSLLSHVLYTVSASYGKHWLLFSHT